MALYYNIWLSSPEIESEPLWAIWALNDLQTLLFTYRIARITLGLLLLFLYIYSTMI